jgi:hypothetical protein
MSSKKEWMEAAERRLVEGLALRMVINELESILSKPAEDFAQAKRNIRRALRKIAVAKEI